MTLRIRAGLVVVVAVVLLGGCVPGPAEPAPSETFDYDVPPRWPTAEEFETDLTFADGAALAGARVEFRNGLDVIYDWATVGTPTETLVEFVNENAGCRVRDEQSAYSGGDGDDETASREFVTALLDGDDLLGGPQLGVEGLGEGMGEGGQLYSVIQALAVPADGGYVFVTGRVFVTLGVQHAIVVHCELGGYLDRTRAQLGSVAYADLRVDEDAVVPVCADDALEIAYFAADGMLGDITGTVRFRNLGATVCGLPGYPVVHLAGSGADTLGPPATPDPDDAPVLLGILPGGTVSAFLTVTPPAGCATEEFDALIVAPPTGGAARRVAAEGLVACRDGSAAQLLIGGTHP